MSELVTDVCHTFRLTKIRERERKREREMSLWWETWMEQR